MVKEEHQAVGVADGGLLVTVLFHGIDDLVLLVVDFGGYPVIVIGRVFVIFLVLIRLLVS